MKKALSVLLILAALIGCAGCNSSPAETTVTTAVTEAPTPADELAAIKSELDGMAGSLTSLEAVEKARELAWTEYVSNIKVNQASRANEVRKNKTTQIKIKGTTMKVMTKVVGPMPDDGYPLFLVYHGGGYDPSGQTNESQWAGMAGRYASVPGIYCSIRSVSDNESSGQIFSTDISWPFYDRIIEDCIVFMNANPNQVYIVGYSAGGNGVYQIAPRITDRLASATMTAGHPEGIDLTNLYNLPFYLQVGELDSAYNRNTITVEYCQKLDALAAEYGGGYYHQCFVHTGKEHGVVGDNASTPQSVIADMPAWLTAQQSGGTYSGGSTQTETHAAKLMTTHTRNPLPERVIWDMATTNKSNEKRGLKTFYWLASTSRSGVVDASYDKATNTITIAKCSDSRATLTVYLNEDMVDLFSPVKIVLPSGETLSFTPQISLDVLRETTAERGDPNYQFCASYTFKLK